MNNYNVKIKYFSDKVYTDTDIQTILHEIEIFTDLSNIISITKTEKCAITVNRESRGSIC